jgi:hypothetical protein
MDDIYLVKLNKDKVYKFAVIIDNKTIKFGRKPYSDFLQHKNSTRRDAYVARHKGIEDWSKSGLKTKGFWARWVLWSDDNNNTLRKAIKHIEDKFNVKIKYLGKQSKL